VNTPTDCVGCHLDDYNNTTDPDHQFAMFPNDCIQCHNEGAWIPSTFDHDGMYFPIYSGKHKDEWNTCMDCHINSSNYSIFSCIDCHEHNNQSQVDDDHSEVDGYQYESNACFMCHPNGEN
jgi:HKD family nuclease